MENNFVSTLVVTTICLFLILGTKNLNKVPGNSQNVLEVIYDLVKNLLLHKWALHITPKFLPFVATIFLFVLGSNVAGALIPWKLIEIPSGELAAPTNDINTTACLAILTSIAYFLLV